MVDQAAILRARTFDWLITCRFSTTQSQVALHMHRLGNAEGFTPGW